MRRVSIIPIEGLPIIKEGDDLARILVENAEKQGTPIREGDVIVVTHVVVSRAEGNTVDLDEVVPSVFAKNIAQQFNKNPALVEVILREAAGIIRMGDGHIIAETRHGFICANAGVDRSNVPGEGVVALLPIDPDRSARMIRDRVRELTGKDVAVLISDTHGR
ncbi:MAG: coenzyme F420-0:L-glutamate ligase, partial [Candidatus Bathyarchaeia archaeon]